MGSVVLVWSALRLATPSVRLERYDGVTRWLPLARAHADDSGSSTARAAFTSAAPMRSSRGG